MAGSSGYRWSTIRALAQHIVGIMIPRLNAWGRLYLIFIIIFSSMDFVSFADCCPILRAALCILLSDENSLNMKKKTIKFLLS